MEGIESRHGVIPHRDERMGVHPTAAAASAAAGPIDERGPILANVELQLGYWGTEWNALAALRTEIDVAARRILASGYIAALREYRDNIGAGGVTRSEVVHGRSEPANDFTPDDIVSLLTDAIDSGHLDEPSSRNNLYIVVTPPGVTLSNDLGAHTFFTYTNAAGRQFIAHIGWITSRGGEVSDYTCTLSHEIVESITDPEFNGIHFPIPAGSDSIPEIADPTDCNAVCYPLADGTIVQSWFSREHGGCIQPT